ncbi:Inositol 1,4,5-trisphosphate receptor-interacting protein-like 1, partial [Tauraco erythrolophus]
QAVKDLVDAFIFFFRDLLSNSFFPELQPAIGVGSAFEGWNPCEKDITYHLLVPLKPPRGHAFHLELSHEGTGPARIFYVRVEQVCTCADEQLAENTLCFLHHPKEELRRNQEPSLLHTLCTGSYLDVHKTARWFHQLVKAAWAVSTLSSQYRLTLLPSNRSFRIEVTKNNTERLNIEMMFGVQEGCSDIFLSSQSTADIFTSSTMWSESYAVAEVEFFRYVAESALANSCYLKCLQVCACIMEGNTFFTSALKTVMMHFLTDLPVSGWCTKDLLLWLWDIMRYLCLCLEHKRLDHFFFANGNVPKGIILPLALRIGEPLNIFQHLAQDPDAHAEALCEFMELQDR